MQLFARHVCRCLGKGDAKAESILLYNTLEHAIGDNRFRNLDDVIRHYDVVPQEIKIGVKRMKQAPVEHAHLLIAITLLDRDSK